MKLNLIKELNADHALLLSKMEEIKSLPETDAGIPRLLGDIKEGLTLHLGKEDREFYPPMRAAAEKNENLRETLKIMGVEMEAITGKAIGLIDGWLENGLSSRFREEFEALFALLKDRIQREETKLYTKYIKLG
ncbi:MAG: hemerythrin domain-containing protein [Spirochaetales bacterium]|nr:hemerythrin domain-containing protein [Spirochaetales bacterium]